MASAEWHPLEIASVCVYGAVFAGYHALSYALTRRRGRVSVMDLAFPLWLHSVALDSSKLTAAIQSVRSGEGEGGGGGGREGGCMWSD
jgi:hypothetical protein